MKNEPTHLEIFQRERIKALEEEVARLKNVIETADPFKAKSIRVIDIRDPDFNKPLSEVFPSAVGEL